MAQVIIDYKEYQRLLALDVKHNLKVNLNRVDGPISLSTKKFATVSHSELCVLLIELGLMPDDVVNLRII